jgi:O-antigen ligase
MANEHPLLGVGHNAFNPSFDQYDFLEGRYGFNRAVHSTWFGTLSELGYPGLLLLIANLLCAFYGLYKVRKAAARGEVAADLGIYASALESSLVVFCVGGTFLSAQYVEMAWHFVGLSAAVAGIASLPREVNVEEANPSAVQLTPTPWAFVPRSAATSRLHRTR